MTAQKGIDVSSKKGLSVILIYVRNVSIMGWEMLVRDEVV
jgi:hypothetical protein